MLTFIKASSDQENEKKDRKLKTIFSRKKSEKVYEVEKT